MRIGGIGARAHPKNADQPLNGGPQMVEVSRDGRRVYVANSLYSPWDAQFYPDGIRGWMAKVDVHPSGGIAFDERFLFDTPRAPAAPGTSRRRRRVIGLVLLRLMSSPAEWTSIGLLEACTE